MKPISPVTFLAGPAGSGKTYTCLREIADALNAAPEGDPLLLVAPKQSTFQLERQLLGMGVAGYTRLKILSFDRLARLVLDTLGEAPKNLLSEEGRVMVLRALLLRHEDELQAFKSVARSAGLAAQASQVLRELQRAKISPEQLKSAAATQPKSRRLAAKLQDLALLLESYRQWVATHSLRDPDDLLEMAASSLAREVKLGRNPIPFAGLWLDGFAEMTLAEIELLAAVAACSAESTLAFCLNNPPIAADTEPSGSIWGVTAGTLLKCKERVEQLKLPITVRRLKTDNGRHRFDTAPALAALAANWAAGKADQLSAEHCSASGIDDSRGAMLRAPEKSGVLQPQGIQIFECVDPEAEALLAARLIHEHVRERGGRYREVSVIVRRMDDYSAALQRTFRRHEIPFFADHREPMGHHPVAELTRSALRMAARGWQNEDWLAALKTGLVFDNPQFVDGLENIILGNGISGAQWQGSDYLRHLSDDGKKLLPPVVAHFSALLKTLAEKPDGPALANAIRTFWSALGVTRQLSRWQEDSGDLPPLYRSIHRTAWEQINSWCDNLAKAFDRTANDAASWLSIAEAGLAGLTLGVIPPALDEVLIGAVDRSRQPEVKVAIVLGFNEGVFPAAPAPDLLLNRAERQLLAEEDFRLGLDRAQSAARERYFAYIACTRPSERLCVAWSRRGMDGKPLVRSAAADQLLALTGLKPAAFDGLRGPEEARSIAELLECPQWQRAVREGDNRLPGAPLKQFELLRGEYRPAAGEKERKLCAASVRLLHPDGTLHASVSGLEDFAACPFRYFSGKELRLKKRDEFKVESSTAGVFLHAVLKAFHEFAHRNGGWRAFTPELAAENIRRIARELLDSDEFAVLRQDAAAAWQTAQSAEGLADTVAQLIRWLGTCSFEPKLAEFRFGLDEKNGGAKGWTIDLGGGKKLILNGSIDRVDVCKLSDETALVAVFDYKTGGKKPENKLLENGLELQLLAYLAFACQSKELQDALGGAQAVPAGVFYIKLLAGMQSVKLAEAEPASERLKAELVHAGRADGERLAQFDSSANGKKVSSGQFRKNDLLPSGFGELLERNTEFLKRHANSILNGEAGIEPVRFSAQKDACEWCDFKALCRFEPLRGGFRTLKMDASGGDTEQEAES